jgi:hypothetical protein
MRELDDITGAIVDAAFQMHRDLAARIVNGFQPSAFPRLRVNPGVSANLNNTGSQTN